MQALYITQGSRPDLQIGFRGHRRRPWYTVRLQSSTLNFNSPLPLSFNRLSLNEIKKMRWETESGGDFLPQFSSRYKPVGLTWTLEEVPIDVFSIQERHQKIKNQLHPDLYTRYYWAVYHENTLQWMKRSSQLSPDLNLENTWFIPLQSFHKREKQDWLNRIIRSNP